jgi:hypothetical protein
VCLCVTSWRHKTIKRELDKKFIIFMLLILCSCDRASW